MDDLDQFLSLANTLGAHLQGDFEGQAVLAEMEDLFRTLTSKYTLKQQELEDERSR